MTVKDIDSGFNKLINVAKELKGSFINVGVLGDESNKGVKNEDGSSAGINMVGLASTHEFGANAGKNGNIRIPERSFIRSTIDERKRRFFGKAFNLHGDILTGRFSVRQALGIMGELIKGNIIQKIVDLKTPPNAPSTIKAKGSSNPLIDTGRLRQSINYEVKA